MPRRNHNARKAQIRELEVSGVALAAPLEAPEPRGPGNSLLVFAYWYLASASSLTFVLSSGVAINGGLV